MVDECALNVGGRAIGRKTLDGHDFTTDRGGGENQTRTNGIAIDKDGAATAFTLLTGTLAAHQPESFSQDIEKAFADPGIANLSTLPVDDELVETGGVAHFVLRR
jgi:hypothetical protein